MVRETSERYQLWCAEQASPSIQPLHCSVCKLSVVESESLSQARFRIRKPLLVKQALAFPETLHHRISRLNPLPARQKQCDSPPDLTHPLQSARSAKKRISRTPFEPKLKPHHQRKQMAATSISNLTSNTSRTPPPTPQLELELELNPSRLSLPIPA